MLRPVLFACILFAAGTAANAQFIDSGSADTPIPRPSVAPPAARTESQEQLLRRLLTAKSQRDAIADKNDPRVKELDSQIAALHVLMDIAAGGNSNKNDVPVQNTPPVYPRIVPPESAPMVPISESYNDASNSAPPQATASAFPDDALNDATRAYLHQQLATTVADHVSFERVLNVLQSQTHKPFYVNWRALEASGVSKETPVSVNLVEAPTDVTLDHVLKLAGGGTGNLAYTIDSGIITISSTEDLSSAKYQTVRMYNVADLMAAPNTQLTLEQAVEVHNYRATQVMDMLKAIVAPDSWRDNGGTIGSIREFDNVLIINQTAENQRGIARVLSQFRQTRGQ